MAPRGQPKTITVYVLRLEHGKYYVGKTENFDSRLRQHRFTSFGAAYTRKHKVLGVQATFPCSGPFDEDRVSPIWSEGEQSH
ncbi:hypothetical protein KIPB_011284 [Kipferlia bialata]|uniref:GIY-YIG domain-containing protein n=1 Tax=Kipferlia bialata TaxID=797122 RepID=A0A9K3D809_9EUKA|nr:hypothetical protein KIPB_011284 [Kipferlia bialata]|eukprot:g11284.t1